MAAIEQMRVVAIKVLTTEQAQVIWQATVAPAAINLWQPSRGFIGLDASEILIYPGLNDLTAELHPDPEAGMIVTVNWRLLPANQLNPAVCLLYLQAPAYELVFNIESWSDLNIGTQSIVQLGEQVRTEVNIFELAIANAAISNAMVSKKLSSRVINLGSGIKLQHYCAFGHEQSARYDQFAKDDKSASLGLNSELNIASAAACELHLLANSTGQVNQQVNLLGSEANFILYSLVDLVDKSLFKYTGKIQHHAVNSHSDCHFKAVLANAAQAELAADLIIPRGSKHASAALLMNNLLLDPRAKITAKPELSVYESEVAKCAHGATCGGLDSECIFYLQSRGLAEAEAKQLLQQGFVAEIFEKITDPQWLAYCQTLTASAANTASNAGAASIASTEV